jgi:CheY-like chemotaxis protein
MLQLNGVTDQVMEFENGSLAYQRLEEIRNNGGEYPNIILLDINMPVLDGWQFLDKFKQFPNKELINLYMVSSSIDPNDQKKAARFEEIKNFYIKPITLDLLGEIINVAA